jgi:hypothetical protein
MTLTRMFVAGDWRAALDGAEERASSPATGEDLGAVAKGDREDARQAVAAAAGAFPGWSAETAFAPTAGPTRARGGATNWRVRSRSTRASRCTRRPTTRSTS